MRRRVVLIAPLFIGVVLPCVGHAQQKRDVPPITAMPDDEFNQKKDLSKDRAKAVLPFLTDDMIEELRARVQGQRRQTDIAANPPVDVAPSRRSIYISPIRSGPVPEIITVYGYPTSISFIDKTGAPWPIHWEQRTNVYAGIGAAPPGDDGKAQGDTRRAGTVASGPPYMEEAGVIASVTIGHGFTYTVPMKGLDGNSLTIQTESPAPRGGVNVQLEGLQGPLPFVLRAVDEGQFDQAVVVHVMALGPNARPAFAAYDDTPATGGADMMNMLEGHPPAQAKPIDVVGVSPDRMRAWRLGNHYYLRTDIHILSPQPSAQAAGDNGAHIYEIPQASVVLVQIDNQTRSIQLQEN